jgi:hypothetical protein
VLRRPNGRLATSWGALRTSRTDWGSGSSCTTVLTSSVPVWRYYTLRARSVSSRGEAPYLNYRGRRHRAKNWKKRWDRADTVNCDKQRAGETTPRPEPTAGACVPRAGLRVEREGGHGDRRRCPRSRGARAAAPRSGDVPAAAMSPLWAADARAWHTPAPARGETPIDLRRYRCPSCGGVVQVLPGFLARNLWRTWATVEAICVARRRDGYWSRSRRGRSGGGGSGCCAARGSCCRC